jgi:hypothetical protein
MVLKASILAQFVIFMPFDVLFKVATQEAGLGVPGQLRNMKTYTCTPTLRSPKPGRELQLGCAFTTRNAFIRRMVTGRPGRSMKGNAHGDDRLRRTVPLRPFPQQDRKTGKC